MNRRNFLFGAGGAAACVMIGGGAWIGTRDIEAARAPWSMGERSFDDPRLNALSYAILAPNPHNQQPWKIELIGDDSVVVHPDTARFLPQTDPPNRQITLGYGAFIELFAQAASAIGHTAMIDVFPDGAGAQALDERPIASIRLMPSEAPTDPLFETIPTRRTNRQPFDMARPVATDQMRALVNATGFGEAVGWSSDAARVSRITTINKAAWKTEMTTAGAHGESTRLTRIGAAEVNAQPDGISLHGPVIEGLSLTSAFSREGMAEEGSFAFTQTHDFYAGLIEATPTYAWLTSPNNTRSAQIEAGRRWVRLNQMVGQSGIAFHPVSQALQEFAEMRGAFADIHAELGVEQPSRVQGLFRLGYADTPAPSPRWPLEEKLISNG